MLTVVVGEHQVHGRPRLGLAVVRVVVNARWMALGVRVGASCPFEGGPAVGLLRLRRVPVGWRVARWWSDELGLVACLRSACDGIRQRRRAGFGLALGEPASDHPVGDEQQYAGDVRGSERLGAAVQGADEHERRGPSGGESGAPEFVRGPTRGRWCVSAEAAFSSLSRPLCFTAWSRVHAFSFVSPGLSAGRRPRALTDLLA